MCIGPGTGWPSIDSRPERLVLVLLSRAAGSDRVDPSPPPSRLIEVHDRTASDRVENIGASADFTRVSPVLPSLPA